MSDYTDNIKRIAGVKDVEDRLKALEEKASIEGNRGIAYKTSTGSVSSASGSTGKEDAATVGAKGAVEAAVKAAKEAKDGTNSGSGNQTSDEAAAALAGTSLAEAAAAFGASDNSVDAEDYLNNPGSAAGASLNGVKSGIGGKLSAITGLYDCASGKGIDVRLDGMWQWPPDRASEGDYPEYEGFIQGFRWSVTGYSTTAEFGSAEQAAEWWIGFSFTPAGLNYSYAGLTGLSFGGGIWSAVANFNDEDGAPAGGVNVDGNPCTPGDLNCPILAPVKRSWPVSDTFQLVKQKYNEDGSIKDIAAFSGHPDDINISPDFLGERSSITACLSPGGDYAGYTLRIDANNLGGVSIYAIDAMGVQAGDARIYNSSNTLEAYASAAQLPNYDP